MIATIEIDLSGPGLHTITDNVAAVVQEANVDEGLCTLFIQHTSASLLIQEDYDHCAKYDLQCWFDRLVPENDPLYTHTAEGEDDMPAHIKAALTACSISVPIVGARLALGSWQGIFLWEHRRGVNRRSIIVHIGT